MKKVMIMGLLFVMCTTAMGQSEKFKTKSWIGVVPVVNIKNGNATMGYGLSFEQQLTKNLGYEFGGFYRRENYPDRNIQPAGGSANNEFISIPVMFKYYNKIVNVAFGFNADFYLGSYYSGALPF